LSQAQPEVITSWDIPAPDTAVVKGAFTDSPAFTHMTNFTSVIFTLQQLEGIDFCFYVKEDISGVECKKNFT
jgi:hypothetical protein